MQRLPIIALTIFLAVALHSMAQAPAAAPKGDLYVLSISVEPKLTNRGCNDPYARDAGHIAEDGTIVKDSGSNK